MGNNRRIIMAAGFGLAGMFAGTAQADLNFSWDGFIRSETAFRAQDRENVFNSSKGGNQFIGHPTCGALPAAFVAGGFFNQNPNPSQYCTNTAINPYAGVNGIPAGQKLVINNPGGGRTGMQANNIINLQMFRLELESQLKFNANWTLQAKVHALVDPGWYDSYSPGQANSSVENPNVTTPQMAGLVNQANLVNNKGFALEDPYSFAVNNNGNNTYVDPRGYSSQRANPGGIYGRPNFYKYQADSAFGVNKSFNQPMEWAGRNYMVYFPALFLEYNKGPLNVRLGMQQIAWGQALFFRILDVPDGLDLRRHSALDLGAEEFSDKRVPAPALRINYQLTDNLVADAYMQKFQPTVIPNPGTPYNLVTDRFSLHDNYGLYSSRGDYGIRLKGQFGDFSAQAIAVHTWNPAGVYHWDITGIHRGLTGLPDGGSAGVDLAQTAFFQDPTGTQSGLEWANDAALAHGNAVTALDAAINDFPGAQATGGFPITTPAKGNAGLPAGTDGCAVLAGITGTIGNPHSKAAYNCMVQEVNAFAALSGGLRGIVTRSYYQENIFGGGLGYVISAEPGTLLDQLIINIEAQYSPERVFQTPDFSYKHDIRKNEWITALVMEKYQRFSYTFPATYFVFQWEHRTRTDLFGRYIGGENGGGMGGDESHVGHGVGGGSDYFVFAFQQPFPNLIWRFDLSMLGDKRGGILVQPAIRWKPNGEWTVNLFYNYLNGNLSTPQENIVSTLQKSGGSEVTLRIGYQF